MRHISELLVYYIIISLILLPFSAADVPDSVENKLINAEKDWLGEFGKVSLIDYGLKSKLEKIDLLLNPNDKLYNEIIGESSAKSLSEKDMAHYSRLAELISPGVAKENSIPLLINGWFYRLYGNTIYATKDNKVIAIDNKTGQIAWHMVLENDLSEGLAVDEDSNVYVATKNELYSISKDGRENWHTHFYSERGKVIGYSNGIVLAQFDDTLLAINKSSNTIWSKSRIAGNIIIDGYDVYATFKSGSKYTVKSLGLFKGNTQWSSQAFPYIIGVELEPKDSQTKAGKTVYAVGDITEEPKEIWALDINTGSEKALQKSTITVCKSGCTYSTIQSGLNAAIPGDIVYVSDGATYVEDIIWPGNITTLDCNGATIQGNGDGFGIIFYYNNYNSVKRCVIDNHESGVYIMYSDSNVIQSNTLKNQRQGIALDSANQNTILSNTVNASNTTSGWSDTFGIVLSYYSSNNTIQGNYIHDATQVGILFISGFETQTQNLIDNNQIYFNEFGIWFEDDSDFNEIKGNTIKDNNEGIRFNFDSTSSDNYIHDNTFCPSNANFDILEESGYGQQGNHGINNRCNTASGWDDDGATGCTFSCGASECGGTDVSCGIYPSCINCNLNDGCYGDYSRNYYCVSNAAGCSYNPDNCNDCSCSCGGYNVAESTASGNCADGKDNDCDGYTDAADPGCVACVCSSGACCDGCNYRATSYKCQADAIIDYVCAGGTGCGQDVFVRHQDRYCSGSSAVCDGALQLDTLIVFDDCTTTENCANNDSTCNYNASCSCVCNSTSGACCDGCNYRASSYLCQQDVTTDYGCPWGTNCGNDVGVHHQDMYCSGSSSVCNGALQWDSWSLADDCATSSEKCTDNDSTCNFDVSCCQCTSGACCDGCSYKPSSYICQQDLTTEYGCPWGNGSGYIRGVHHQDKYCSGSSENCSGSLQWDAWAFYQDCGFLSCGAWSANYCIDGDVYHNRSCEDGGCLGTTCFYTGQFFELGLVADCQYGCGNGLCLGHCENGIKDSDETGIDCGGSCPNQECCNNGYADVNLGEQGVDCEGPCPYSCIVPVILVHGYMVDDPNSTWGNMSQRLRADNFTVEIIDLEESGRAKGDIKAYAGKLRNFVEATKKKHNAKKVDIVAHSLGGLASRWFTVMDEYLYQNDVRRLIMLGTPNHGSDLFYYEHLIIAMYAGILITGMAGIQMTPNSPFLNTLNYGDWYQLWGTDMTAPAVLHKTIAGTNSGSVSGWALRPFGRNDGWVTTTSSSIDYIPQEELYLSHSELHDDGAAYSLVKSFLLPGAKSSEYVPPQKAGEGNLVQELPRIISPIYSGQEKIHNITLDSVGNVSFILAYLDGRLNFTLVSPNGTLINPAYAAANNIIYYDSTLIKSYEIELPEAGVWSLHVYGYNLSVNGTEYAIYTFIESNITLNVYLSSYVLKPNEQLNISAELKNGLNPITGATLTAKIKRPDNSETFTFLYDDGTHNDNLSNDGVYGNIYSQNLTGQYDLTVTAAGAGFEREKFTIFWAEDYPDLTITNMTFSDNSPIVGKNVTISAYVKNLKNIDTFNATIEFYYNGRYEDIFIGNRTINVPRLGTGTASVVWTPDLGGTYNITAIISPFNDFMEGNYTNNVYVKNLSVGYLGFNKQLYSGWNLVSVPFALKNSTLPTALDSINGSYNVVFAYDANDVGNEWKSYDPIRPAFLNNLAELNPKLGYWIDMKGNDILELQGAVPATTTLNLKQGWNLVGYPSLNQTNATILFAPIANNLEVVFKYDTNNPGNEWKSYNPEMPGFLNTLTIMQPGYGYWVKATQGTSLTVS